MGIGSSLRRPAVVRAFSGAGTRSDDSVLTAEWVELRGRVRTEAGTAPARRRWWSDPRIVVPTIAGAVFVAVVALRLPGLLSSFYWYSDFPNALQLGSAVFHGGWGQGLMIRSQSGLGSLWVVGLLDQVTGNLVAGMAFGGLTLLAAAGLMMRTAQRVVGSRRALAVAVLCIAAPPVVAWEALSPLAHITTLLLTAAAAWQLVHLSRPTRGRALWSSVVVGVIAGVCVASDTLALAAAVIPWLLCAFVLVRRRPERRLPVATTVCAAVLAGLGVTALAGASGIVATGLDVNAPSLQGIFAGLRVTASTLGQMLSGGWYNDVLPGAMAIAALVLFLGLLYFAVRGVTRRSATPVAGRSIYVSFWVLSSGGLIASLCLTGLGIQASPVNYQGHYLDGLWFAIAALLPVVLWSGRSWRNPCVAAVAVLTLISAAGVARVTAFPFQGPDYTDATQLLATLQHLGVTHGYGGYWESYAIGWHTDQQISALPLQSCTDASGAPALCRYEYAPPALYQAQPGPVFVIVVRGSCDGDDLCIDTANLDGLPKPELVRTVGLLQVDVFAHDAFADLPQVGLGAGVR
jgi:hypothetical protein